MRSILAIRSSLFMWPPSVCAAKKRELFIIYNKKNPIAIETNSNCAKNENKLKLKTNTNHREIQQNKEYFVFFFSWLNVKSSFGIFEIKKFFTLVQISFHILDSFNPLMESFEFKRCKCTNYHFYPFLIFIVHQNTRYSERRKLKKKNDENKCEAALFI